DGVSVAPVDRFAALDGAAAPVSHHSADPEAGLCGRYAEQLCGSFVRERGLDVGGSGNHVDAVVARHQRVQRSVEVGLAQAWEQRRRETAGLDGHRFVVGETKPYEPDDRVADGYPQLP